MKDSTVFQQTLLIDNINPISIELAWVTLNHTKVLLLYTSRNNDRPSTIIISNCDFNAYVTNGFGFDILPNNEFDIENVIQMIKIGW